MSKDTKQSIAWWCFGIFILNIPFFWGLLLSLLIHQSLLYIILFSLDIILSIAIFIFSLKFDVKDEIGSYAKWRNGM